MTDRKNIGKALSSVAFANEALAVAFWASDEWQLARAITSIRNAADALGYDIVKRQDAPVYVADSEALDRITVGKG